MTNASVIGWLLIGIGVALVAATACLLVLARRSASWPSVPGKVLTSAIDTSSATSKSGGTTYRLALTYAYEVAGHHLEGHRVAFGDNLWGGTRSRDEVQARVTFYHPGRALTVYYDPQSPGRCTLTPGVGNLPFNATLAVGAALVIVGASAMLGWIRVQ